MTYELPGFDRERDRDRTEHDEIVDALETALSIIKANENLTRENALGIVRKQLEPISPESF